MPEIQQLRTQRSEQQIVQKEIKGKIWWKL